MLFRSQRTQPKPGPEGGVPTLLSTAKRLQNAISALRLFGLMLKLGCSVVRTLQHWRKKRVIVVTPVDDNSQYQSRGAEICSLEPALKTNQLPTAKSCKLKQNSQANAQMQAQVAQQAAEMKLQMEIEKIKLAEAMKAEREKMLAEINNQTKLMIQQMKIGRAHV